MWVMDRRRTSRDQGREWRWERRVAFAQLSLVTGAKEGGMDEGRGVVVVVIVVVVVVVVVHQHEAQCSSIIRM